MTKSIQNYVPSGCNVHDEEHPELCRDVEDLIAPVNASLAYRSIGSLGGGELIATGTVKTVHS